MIKIYLLPGLMTDERLWSKLSLYLNINYQLVHIDIPLKDDFDQVCAELDKYFLEDKINLLGFSFGSYIAAYYAIKNPSRINRLFLLAGSGSFLNENEIKRRRDVLDQMDKFGFKGISHKKVLDIIEDKNHNDLELIDTIKNMFFDLGKQTYKKQMELSFKRVDISEELSSLSMPITFYYTQSDKLFDYKALAKISKKSCENISFVQKQGSSHFIPLEDPMSLAKGINEWMA